MAKRCKDCGLAARMIKLVPSRFVGFNFKVVYVCTECKKLEERKFDKKD